MATLFTPSMELFSWGDQLLVWDIKGYEIARIRQQWHVMPFYVFYLGETWFVEFVKPFACFKKTILLDVVGNHDYLIYGDFCNYEYEFQRRNELAATVSRRFWSKRYS